MAAITTLQGISLQRSGDKPWAHARGCRCGVTDTFTCNRCGRRVGLCMGGIGDAYEGACDFCWAAGDGTSEPLPHDSRLRGFDVEDEVLP